jgi:endonuclease/exonuclease/phosphatase family metal-dependent hydrolase
VVKDVFAPFDPLARVASDHLPLVMDFEVRLLSRRSRLIARA